MIPALWCFILPKTDQVGHNFCLTAVHHYNRLNCGCVIGAVLVRKRRRCKIGGLEVEAADSWGTLLLGLLRVSYKGSSRSVWLVQSCALQQGSLHDGAGGWIQSPWAEGCYVSTRPSSRYYCMKPGHKVHRLLTHTNVIVPSAVTVKYFFLARMMSPGKEFLRAAQWRSLSRKGVWIVFPEPPALAMQIQLPNWEWYNARISDGWREKGC